MKDKARSSEAGLHFEKTRLALPHRSEPLFIEGLLPAGQVTALMGPSGCGKSSLLSAIALLSELPLNQSEDFKSSLRLQTDHGSSTASKLDASQWNCSLVFQQPALFEHLSVIENLCFPLRFHAPWKDWSSALRAEHALKCLDDWQLAGLKDKHVSQLSGGEAQRLALLQGTIFERNILLLDESLSSIDKQNKKHIKERVRSHVVENNVSCLLVTHSEEDCQNFVDRTIQWPDNFAADNESAVLKL